MRGGRKESVYYSNDDCQRTAMKDEWPLADLSIELPLEHMEERAVTPAAVRRGACAPLSISVKWNTNLMQHCARFISAESLYMFRAQAPIIRSI